MSNPVEFGLALSNSHPSGTGSFSYDGKFHIVVENLAFQKQVSIWAQVSTVWTNIEASYAQSLPDNRELWTAPASNSEGEFVAKYEVNNTTHWDNNSGINYKFPQAFDQFLALAGNNYKVVLGTASLASALLHVAVGVQNLAFNKVVGIVFTTDNWATTQTAFANFSSTMKSGLEVWNITASIGTATEVKLAVFYRVLGTEYWDNNFWRDYRVTAGTPQKWGDAP